LGVALLSHSWAGGAVVCGNALIHGFFQLIGKTIKYKAQLLLDPPVEPLNLTPSLGMVGCAKNVFYTAPAQILCGKPRNEPEPLSE
jgi:hypothetical protein